MAFSIRFNEGAAGVFPAGNIDHQPQKTEAISLCKTGDLRRLKRLLKRNEFIYSTKNEEGLNLFQICLFNKKFDVASYLVNKYPYMLEEEISCRCGFGFYLYQKGKIYEHNDLLELYPNFLSEKNHEEETLFFKAFNEGEFLLCETALQLVPSLLRLKK